MRTEIPLPIPRESEAPLQALDEGVQIRLDIFQKASGESRSNKNAVLSEDTRRRLEMQALKNAELTQRKNELIERLREWKSTTFKKGKSPKKSPGKDSQKENGSMVSLNLNRSSVNVGENTQKRGSVDSGDLRMELEEPFVQINLTALTEDLEFMSAGRNPSLNNTSLKGEQVV